MEHAKIKLAACVPLPDELRGEEVKAYIVLQAGESRDTVPPETIVAFAKQKLAYFKVPRYIEYVADLPRTPSERVEKHKLIAAKKDLRVGSYDALDKKWR
jgi:crotonobetaine/carnitine-CoA ligase